MEHRSGLTFLERRNGWNVYRTGLPVGRPEAVLVTARNDERYFFPDRASSDEFTKDAPCPYCGARVSRESGRIFGHTTKIGTRWDSCPMSGQEG